MSNIIQLKAFITERLTAAAEEIFGVFEQVINVKYYDEDPHSKRDIERQNRQLDLVLTPDIRIQRADPPQLSVCKEVPCKQQERSPSLGQEDPEPPQIKEEQEETWTSQEGEQLQWLEEADTKDSIFTTILVRSLHDQHQRQSPHLNQTVENREGEPLPNTSTEQMKTEADGEGCGVSELTSDCQPLSSYCSVAESDDTDRSEDWTESGGSQSGLKTNSSQAVKRQSSRISSNGRKSMESSHLPIPHCSVDHKGFPSIREFDVHMKTRHAGEEPYTRSVIGKGFSTVGHMKVHMSMGTGEKPYGFSVCERNSRENGKLSLHMKTHTGEKPCSCIACERKLWAKSTYTGHMNTHTGRRPHCCNVCGKGFSKVGNMKAHMSIHTGEKPYSCSVCERKFREKGKLKQHMKTHTGEKPYTCSVCEKKFRENGKLKQHMITHTGEKPYTCSVCGKGFSQVGNMKVHMRIHTVS